MGKHIRFNYICFIEPSNTYLNNIVAKLTILAKNRAHDDIKAIAMASKATYNRVLKTLMVEFEKEDVKSREQAIELVTSIVDSVKMEIEDDKCKHR